VQDELKDFAFDYAYELYSDEDVIRRRRLQFEENAAKENGDETNEFAPSQETNK
jgi:hypothetical protein